MAGKVKTLLFILQDIKINLKTLSPFAYLKPKKCNTKIRICYFVVYGCPCCSRNPKKVFPIARNFLVVYL